MTWDDKFSADAGSIDASEIRELLKILADPEILSFAGGIPDPALFPMEQVRHFRERMIDQPDQDRQLMQYSQTEGYAPLRDWVAETCSCADNTLSRDNILITNGAQQSLTLLASALIDADTPIAVANPTYLGALQVFGCRRPNYITIETDNNGLMLDGVEAAFKQGVKFLYTVPDFQNPGGMTIPLERRQKIIELAHEYDVIILEDTAYRALYYDAPPPASLLEVESTFLGKDNWNDKGLVIQLGTASKTLMPALRVGWTIAPTGVLDKLVLLKQANDLHTSTVNQTLTFELANAIMEPHLEELRNVYGERCKAMIDALTQNLPNSVNFTPVTGGMFVWLDLPEGMNARKLLEKSLAEEKIAFVPGAAFHANGGGDNTLRLSFSTCTPEVIHDGMKRLANLIRSEL
ncbi:PLP-dependent aminotransferase family protein [Terasakiella sp. A23]|uniref:aminotransferase-like domain-containing protein n=1 Tax=Terasakiella sp. FCG-A23 TaxID=3080561 RepID=UPI0029542F80|nr:PLP-dependent aminotransferase family protein [Terasakiella sp. A23]MDV7341330.1 PLP-dependent aminotransferase family protein [Terasakiella sp. A23]